MTEHAKLTWQKGTADRLGVAKCGDMTRFAVAVPDGLDAELLLYHLGRTEPCQVIPLKEKDRVGEVNCVQVRFDGGKYEYNYRIDGQILPDPYAPQVTRRKNARTGEEALYCSLNASHVSASDFVRIPYEDSIFYKIHVRGFTKHRSSGVKHPGTFLGIIEKIPYLRDLGVTSLILMPVYEFEDRVQLPGSTYYLDGKLEVMRPQEDCGIRKNYWGYSTGLYFAPKASYCATKSPNEEFSLMVDRLHEAGMEVVLEFYFSSDADSQLVLDVLHHWLLRFHVDGFRLMGEGGWLHAIMRDPLLTRTKILNDVVDTERLYHNGKLPVHKNLAEMNRGFEIPMRKFLKSDLDIPVSRVAEIMRRRNSQKGIIQYLADNDGFTMADMVAYEEKHNDENGQNNQDGIKDNYTWNCGEEGPTRKKAVRDLRRKQLRNAFAFLLTAQGTPMIYGGDEFENSQRGNNNCWCQDNATGWLNWNKSKSALALTDFVKKLLKFRREHQILHMKADVRLVDYKSIGFPDLSYHSDIAWMMESGGMKEAFGILYCSEYENPEDPVRYIYIAYNMYWREQFFALPVLPEGYLWYLKVSTASDAGIFDDGEEPCVGTSEMKSFPVRDRSVVILTAVRDGDKETE